RLAEQAAWRLWDQHRDRLDLVVVNPSFVVGPPQSASLNASLETVVNYLLGRAKKATPGRLPFVDVRDVALAHVIAMEQDGAIGHRVFCASETRPWRDLAIKLKELFPEYPNVEDLDVDTGIETQMDTSLLQGLGLSEFISFDQMLKDTVEQMIKLGVVENLKQTNE
ncbi:cinnamoylCoA reductase, partial [Acanthamoeba castellanii str. Neff]